MSECLLNNGPQLAVGSQIAVTKNQEKNSGFVFEQNISCFWTLSDVRLLFVKGCRYIFQVFYQLLKAYSIFQEIMLNYINTKEYIYSLVASGKAVKIHWYYYFYCSRSNCSYYLFSKLAVLEITENSPE